IFSVFTNWQGSKLDRFTDRFWYSENFNSSWEHTDIERRPTDCDFIHAPIGSKQCSYKKQVLKFTDVEKRELAEKMNTVAEKDEVARRPNTVTVYWERKAEP